MPSASRRPQGGQPIKDFLFGANAIFRIPITGCATEFSSRLTHPPVRAREIKELPKASTTEIAKNKNRGFTKNKFVAREGGNVAGKARIDLEKRSGKKVSTRQNYLPEVINKKRLKQI